MSGFLFGGRRILRDGSSSMISSASAHAKKEWRTEMTFDRVAALLSRHRPRKARSSAVDSSERRASG
jgi:hypothetical protein